LFKVTVNDKMEQKYVQRNQNDLESRYSAIYW